MKLLLQKLFNSQTNNFLSIKELKDLKVLERKIKLAKSFRQYIYDLNKKQREWLKRNSLL
tara:strand:+ start:8689 stop:8868 length:180 start_codon:yes stop_codon:yes gene_type:complete